jgi:hypothetical protein
MRALGRQLRLLGALLTDPRHGLQELAASPPLWSVLGVLGLLQATAWLAQSLLLEPALRADAWRGEGAEALPPFQAAVWGARLLLFCGAPVAMALRACGLAGMLQTGAACAGQALPWRPLLSLALHLDIVFWVESAATTLLLAVARPATLDALHTLYLRAGLDLVWQPAHPAGRQLLAAANLFSLWWSILLGLGLAVVLRLSRRTAVVLAGAAWAALVVVRFLFIRN